MVQIDMEMPKNCAECPFNVEFNDICYCCLINGCDGLMPDSYEEVTTQKLSKCPLREVKK